MRNCTSYWETNGKYGTLNDDILSRLIKLFSGDMAYFDPEKNEFEIHKIAVKLFGKDMAELQHFNSELRSVVGVDSITTDDVKPLHYIISTIPDGFEEDEQIRTDFSIYLNSLLLEKRYVSIHVYPYPICDSSKVQMDLIDKMEKHGFVFKGKVNLHNKEQGTKANYRDDVAFNVTHSYLLHFRKMEECNTDGIHKFSFSEPTFAPFDVSDEIPSSVFDSYTKTDPIGKKHPAPYSPDDIARLLNMLKVTDGWVLDPFMGVASTHIGCIKSNHNHGTELKAVGIDMSPEYVGLAKQRVGQLIHNPDHFIALEGDSWFQLKKKTNDDIDECSPLNYCVTSPPYHNILRNDGKGVRADKSEQFRKGVKYYSDKKHDLGNQPSLDSFFTFFKDIMSFVLRKIEPDSFCSIVISDFTVDKLEQNISAMTVNHLSDSGWEFCGTIVLNQRNKAIAPFGYPYAYVINHTNQYILNFRRPSEDES